MKDPLICPKPNCMVRVKLTNSSRENDYCKFQEAECPCCHQLYWVVGYDDIKPLRIREADDDVEFFEPDFIAEVA